MKTKIKKMKIGIVGCGAIGSRLAKSVSHELKNEYVLSGLFDIDAKKSHELAKRLSQKNIVKSTYADLLCACNLVVEAVSATNIDDIVTPALKAKKDILIMSVGRLLEKKKFFSLAKKK